MNKGKGFIAIYNPGRLHARAEVYYNVDYSTDIDDHFGTLSLVLECNIQILDLKTGKHIMLHAGDPLV